MPTPPLAACSGTVCTQAVPDALCQAFGFDMAWSEAMGGTPPVITNATLAEPVRSLTGEVSGAWGAAAAACALALRCTASPPLPHCSVAVLPARWGLCG